VEPSKLVKAMNAHFYAFDASNPKSSYGLYIRQADKAPIQGDSKDQDVGIFCGLPCWGGQSECRVSGAVYNSKQMINHGSAGTTVAWDFGKGVGWWVNQTIAVKCSYAWDGATPTKYNRGCGCTSGITDCNDPNNAWKNTDPTTRKNYTGDSDKVKDCACETGKSQHPKPTAWEQGPNCFWKGPAYDTPRTETTDDTWQMMSWRVQKQGYNPFTPLPNHVQSPVAYWNEVIVDGVVLLDMLKKDPAGTIPAIVYTKGDALAKSKARHVAQVMQKAYFLSKPVPVIALDTKVDITKGGDVFIAEADWTFEQAIV